VGSSFRRLLQPQAVPDIGREDLLLPNEASKLRTLALCSICAFGMTILLAFTLFALAIFLPLGRWFLLSLGGLFVGLTLLLFVVSTFEARQLRRPAREL
jgi:hypothetical protein